MPIIEVIQLTKEYKLGHITSLKKSALNTLRYLTSQPIHEREIFKALDNVSFTIEKGEVVGIIGHNGAGKSTLLKHLAGISTPTTGKVIVRGSVAPLIEVGAGVNPELTGRENIYLNAAILGIPKKIVRQKIDEIINFSELEQFIDTPVKRYSSGMTVKLGFSIATSMNADILIVDEVLAVGDLAFQRKCLDRMETIINNDGSTVLIVGHNIRQLERICTRMILLNQGKIEADGAPGQISKLFFDESTRKIQTQLKQHNKIPIKNQEVKITKIELPNHQEIDGFYRVNLFSDLVVRITLCSQLTTNNIEINIGLHTAEMLFITKSSSLMKSDGITLIAGENIIEITFRSICLTPGPYGLGLGIYDWTRRSLGGGTNLIAISIDSPIELTPKLPLNTLTFQLTDWNFMKLKKDLK